MPREARFKYSALCAFLLLSGCAPKDSRVRMAIPPTEIDPWVLVESDPNASEPALLWNGNVGIRLHRSGSPVGADSKMLPAFSINSFEASGEEKILELKDWYSSRAAQPPFVDGQVEQYRQSLDMRNGLLTTTWIMREKSRRISVKRESILDPYGSPVWGEQWTMKPATTGDARSRKESPIEDQFSHTQYLPADFDGGNPPVDDFATLQERGKRFWEEFWETDIVIDGPVEDQRAIRSFLFYLRTGIAESNERAISPMGLSNSIYFGHVFWDADVWVFPALCLLDPERASTIPAYRVDMVEAARRNYLNWVKAGRPVGVGPSLGNSPPNPEALMFPWESSVSGLETVPGPSKFQHHITGTVAFAAKQAAALDLISAPDADRIGKGAFAFFMDRSSVDPKRGRVIRGTMSPDEFHTGDNDLYTNALGNWLLDSLSNSETKRFAYPKDAKSWLTYDNDPVRTYKQAAAVLGVFPLQDPLIEPQARQMLERFAPKVIKNGPAMSDSVHSVIWSRLGEPEKAYAAWRKSWQKFTNHPLMLFSEKRSSARTYFTTGAGGSLQSVLYGFAGLRISNTKAKSAKWQIPLKEGFWLSCNPALPKEWKSMNLKGLRILGNTYDLEIQGENVRATERLTTP